MTKIYTSHSAAETKKIGRELAHRLRKIYEQNQCIVIGLVGELGAGKTCLTKGIAAELNIKQTVTSPSYLIVKEYKEGKIPLYHFDFYRLNTEQDLDSFGFFDYFTNPGFFVIEWAEKFEQCLPDGTFFIHLETLTPKTRNISTTIPNS